LEKLCSVDDVDDNKQQLNTKLFDDDNKDDDNEEDFTQRESCPKFPDGFGYQLLQKTLLQHGSSSSYFSDGESTTLAASFKKSRRMRRRILENARAENDHRRKENENNNKNENKSKNQHVQAIIRLLLDSQEPCISISTIGRTFVVSDEDCLFFIQHYPAIFSVDKTMVSLTETAKDVGRRAFLEYHHGL
jgi:hypothetical protein